MTVSKFGAALVEALTLSILARQLQEIFSGTWTAYRPFGQDSCRHIAVEWTLDGARLVQHFTDLELISLYASPLDVIGHQMYEKMMASNPAYLQRERDRRYRFEPHPWSPDTGRRED